MLNVIIVASDDRLGQYVCYKGYYSNGSLL